MSSVDHQPEASQVKPFIVGKVTSNERLESRGDWNVVVMGPPHGDGPAAGAMVAVLV